MTTAVMLHRRLILPAILLLAAALRIPVLRADLWLDELWSVGIAEHANTLADIWQVSAHRVDNNHPLLTAWLYLVGRVDTPGAWWIYRLPSLLAGLLTIVAGYSLAKRYVGSNLKPQNSNLQPELTPALTSLWLALALPFVVYSTEARGYAIALAAMMGCLVLLVGQRSAIAKGRSRVSPGPVLAFWLLCAVGLTAHFSFVHALVGFVFLGRPFKRNVVLHGVPFALAAIIYLGFIRHLKVAGGPPQATLSAIAGMASMLAGGPWFGTLAWITAACVVPPFLLVAWGKRREPFVQGAIAACAMALLTVFVKGIALGRPEVVYPRYFLLAATWAGLVLTLEVCRQISDGWSKKRPALWIPFALIAAVTLGFAALDSLQFLLRGGRGEYLALLQIVASSTEPSLASDYDSRTQRVLGYYQRFLPAKIFYLHDGDARDPSLPRWYLANTATDTPPAPTRTYGNHPYHLRQAGAQFGPSGWSWQLYERE